MTATLLAPFALIGRHRRLLMATALSELRGTYAGSILGLAWIVVGPLLLLAIYAVVYAVIFRVRPVDLSSTEYVLYVFSGLVPFLAFSQSLTAGSLAITKNRSLLLNTVFPTELIAARDILVASASLPAGLLVLLLCDAALATPTASLLLLPVIVVLQTMFVLGICWVVSLAAVVIRDVQQILTYLTIVLLVVTPVGYTPKMVPAGLTILMVFNPLYYFVSAYQHVVVLDELPPVGIMVGCAVLGGAAFLGGFLVHSRIKQALVDFA